MAQHFLCTLVTPEEQLFEHEVQHVSLPAWDGQIGVLARRAPLLAQLGYGPLEVTHASGQRERYFIGGGFVQMSGNRLTILTSEARLADALDAESAEAELKEALALRGLSPEQAEKRDKSVARARGLVAVASGR